MYHTLNGDQKSNKAAILKIAVPVVVLVLVVAGSLGTIFLVLEKRISVSQDSISSLQDSVSSLQDSNRNLQAENDDLKNVTKILQEENQYLLNITENLQLDYLKNVTDAFQAENEYLKNLTARLEAEGDYLQNLTRTFQGENEYLRNVTETLQQQIDELKAQVAGFQQQIGGLQEDDTHLTSQIGTLYNSTEVLSKSVQALNQMVSSPKPPCNLQCEHGGYPNADCTACTGCGAGWTGSLCNVPSTCAAYCTQRACQCFNGGTLNSGSCQCECLNGWSGSDCSVLDTKVSVQDRIAVLAGLKKKALDNLQAATPTIPSTLGNGVDMTTRTIGLPVLQLTVSSNDTQTVVSPSNTLYNIPDGVNYGEILGGIEWPVRDTYVFEHFYSYVYQMFQWGNDEDYIKPLLQGVTLQQIKDKYFTKTAFMAMTQAYYGAYSLELARPLSAYSLEENAKRAIDYIAGLPFNEDNSPVFYYFIQNWGTSVLVEEVQGGFLQYACIVQSAIWNWGGRSKVTPDFIKGETEGLFADKMQGTSYTSGVFSQNSVCNFLCTGGNPEKCPTSSGVNTEWPSTIWADPETVKYNVVPLSELLSSAQAKQSIQTAVYSYYASQVSQYEQAVQGCDVCLPSLNSFVLAANVPYNQATTVNAQTCSTAIRITAWGSCSFVMTKNGNPIHGGSGACDYHDTALWGVAGYYGITNPIVEWIVTEVDIDNTFVSSTCNYPDMQCNYWTGHYSVFCV